MWGFLFSLLITKFTVSPPNIFHFSQRNIFISLRASKVNSSLDYLVEIHFSLPTFIILKGINFKWISRIWNRKVISKWNFVWYYFLDTISMSLLKKKTHQIFHSNDPSQTKLEIFHLLWPTIVCGWNWIFSMKK